MSALASTLQAFFTDRLIGQRDASPHTIASYRDTLRLLLVFTAQQTGKLPTALDIDDLDAPLIGAFLNHLEHERGNTPSTRNVRLAAIRSLLKFAALRHPEHAATIQRVLAIPPKRHQRALVSYLTEPELDALLVAPDRATWTGRRDHAMVLLAAQTGLRATELLRLARADLHLDTGPHVNCTGKGRKRRITPLTSTTVAVLRVWLTERSGSPDDPLFPTRTGRPLSRDALERRLATHADTAARTCPSLREKTVTAHVLRHTAAMRLLHAGVDTSVIALWLGHEQIDTTRTYTPTSNSKSERSPRPSRPTPNPAATGRPTPCSPSSTRSDNADPQATDTACRAVTRPDLREACLVLGVLEAAVGRPPVAFQHAAEARAEDAVGLLVAAARGDQVDGDVVADEHPQPLPVPGHAPAGLIGGDRRARADGEHQRLTRRLGGTGEAADRLIQTARGDRHAEQLQDLGHLAHRDPELLVELRGDRDRPRPDL